MHKITEHSRVSASASAPPCTPGKNGLPDGWIPRFLCDPGEQTGRIGHAMLRVLAHVAAAWPAVLALAAVIAAIVLAVGRITALRCSAFSGQGNCV